MQLLLRCAVCSCLICLATTVEAAATPRKASAPLQGDGGRKLVGYGLVVGLDGTGGANPTTREFVGNLLKQRCSTST